ncbi:MAG: ATP-binding cassette domain-containing protein, partial [bacterium]
MINLRSVHKTFRGRDGAAVEALRDISLDIAPGEFVAIVGASGCGKSTLLRLVAGLVPTTSGQVILDDAPVMEPRTDT